MPGKREAQRRSNPAAVASGSGLPVALPETMRDRYTAHLMEITDQAPQLLITFNYDQRLLDGPPFSISDEEVGRRYQDSYDLKLLESADVPGGLKGKCPAKEKAWLLK